MNPGPLRPDATGAAAVTELFEYARRYELEFVCARVRVRAGTRALLRLAGVEDEIGEERFFATVRGAVHASVEGSAVGPDEPAQ